MHASKHITHTHTHTTERQIISKYMHVMHASKHTTERQIYQQARAYIWIYARNNTCVKTHNAHTTERQFYQQARIYMHVIHASKHTTHTQQNVNFISKPGHIYARSTCVKTHNPHKQNVKYISKPGHIYGRNTCVKTHNAHTTEWKC